MAIVWVLAPRDAGPVLVRSTEESIIDAAERVRDAMELGTWLEGAWTPVPWGDDHWVRSLSGGAEWEIIAMQMDDSLIAHLAGLPAGGSASETATKQWLESVARQHWLSYRSAHPEAATWLPPFD